MEQITHKKSSLARYRGMILSIAVFLLLIFGILAVNFYATAQLEKNTIKLNAAGQMRDLIQTMTRDLFNLKLSWGEDPNSPHIQTTLKRLGTNKALFDSNLKAFEKGGMIRYADEHGVGHGHEVAITALTNTVQKKLISSSQQEWNIFGVLIQQYLNVSQDVQSDSTNLDLAVDQAQSSSNNIYAAMSSLASSLEKQAQTQANVLKVIQVSGIVGSIVYFIVFVFYFLRKLRRADEEAEEARRETSEIMATVNEGLFLVDKSLNVSSQYSRELESIIGQRNIGGKSLSEVLEAMVSKEDLETTRGFVNQLFNARVKAGLISDLNPLSRIKVEVDDFSGYYVSRYLDFKFSRVYYGKEIERVLVSVTDITSAVNLEQRLAQEREQNDQQIEMLATILNTDNTLLQSFIGSVRNCIGKINATLRNPGKSTPELHGKVRDIYREIHSMKGEASALKLHGFVTIADSFEEKLKKLQNSPAIGGNDFLPLTVMLDELIGLFNTVERLSKRIGILPDSGGQTAAAMSSGDTQVMRHYFENFAQDMAKRNGKQVNLVCHGMDDATLPPEPMSLIKEISVQLLRNAITHGIETPDARSRVGKSASGQVQILLTRPTQESAELIVEDDGGGINFEKIRQKAVYMGYYSDAEAANLDRKQLLALMFTSGFSTAEGSNEDAGRGVGMDVIKDRIQSLKGNLKVASNTGQYTRFTISLPITH